MSTFLELTNGAIEESGADLDPIDVSDFADPTKSLQRKFKRWTQKAWYEIQMESNNHEFMSKQAQIILRPRLLVIDGDRASDPPVGSTYEGDDTGASFEIVDVITISGGFATGDAVAYLEYENLEDGPFKWGELYDELTPTPTADIFRLKFWGTYSLQDEVADLLEPNISSFMIQSTGGSATQTNTPDADNRNLEYIPFVQFQLAYQADSISRGQPQCFTITPDGRIDFFPRMDKEYLLTFQYSAEPQELDASNDSPEGLPAQYHDAILWRAVMYWADFSESQSQFLRANRRFESIKNRMERNQKPGWSFSPNLFNLDTRW